MLHNFSSIEPLTPFTPTWSIDLWVTEYNNKENLCIMKDWIEQNAPIIKEKNKDKERNDGGTGLGLDSLTSNFQYFDLFDEAKHINAFVDYKLFVQDEYRKFCKKLNVSTQQCVINSWANIVHTGQKIKKHNHGATHFSYLSGNGHLEDYETSTVYFNPYDNAVRYTIPNRQGGLTLFPSYLYHASTEHVADNDRFSVAFDILVKDITPEPVQTLGTEFNNI